MKVLALSSSEPGLRYRAHLHTVKASGVELVVVSLDGWRLTAEKVRRHLRIIRRRGPIDYVHWMSEKRTGNELRNVIGSRLAEIFRGSRFLREPIEPTRTFNGFSKELVHFIEREHPDAILQCGAGLVPGWFVRLVPPILNVHPGILPGIRGVDPTFWAHYYGRPEWLGSTIHYIDHQIDVGTPLVRKLFMPGNDYIESLVRQIEMETDLLRRFFSLYPNGVGCLDEGGCADSVYRSAWSRNEYDLLAASGWWGAADLPGKPRSPMPRPSDAIPTRRRRRKSPSVRTEGDVPPPFVT